jgi:hypothetical protein
MPSPQKKSLGPYLEWHGRKIRVVVRVPPLVKEQLGAGKLKETLPTTSPRDAETLKWAVIARLKDRIQAARKHSPGTGDALLKEAYAWREAIRQDDDE